LRPGPTRGEEGFFRRRGRRSGPRPAPARPARAGQRRRLSSHRGAAAFEALERSRSGRANAPVRAQEAGQVGPYASETPAPSDVPAPNADVGAGLGRLAQRRGGRLVVIDELVREFHHPESQRTGAEDPNSQPDQRPQGDPGWCDVEGSPRVHRLGNAATAASIVATPRNTSFVGCQHFFFARFLPRDTD